MRELYTLELIQLVKELKWIEGFYIDQFYELDKNRFRLKLSMKGEKANLQCILPYSLSRTETIEIKESATNFSIATRKRIAGARISSIEQLNNDRILAIRIVKGGADLNIILEMFGRGNLVITDKDMKILLAYRVHDFKDRRVRPNAEYKLPENSAINVSQDGWVERVRSGMQKTGRNIQLLNYLTKSTGIGKMYVEEALARAGASANSRVGEMNDRETNAVLESIADVVSECTESPKLIAYVKNGRFENLSICSIEKFAKLEKREFDSLEKCLEFAYQNLPEQKEEINLEEERILTSIEKQKDILKGIDLGIESSKKAGDYIMSHMQELNAMINEMKGAVKNNNALESVYVPEGARIISIDKKDKIVKLEIRDSE